MKNFSNYYKHLQASYGPGSLVFEVPSFLTGVTALANSVEESWMQMEVEKRTRLCSSLFYMLRQVLEVRL